MITWAYAFRGKTSASYDMIAPFRRETIDQTTRFPGKYFVIYVNTLTPLFWTFSDLFTQHLWGFQVTRSFVRCNSVSNDLPSTTKNDGTFYETSFPKCNIKSYLVFKYKRTKVSARTFRGQINIDKILCRYQSHILIMFSLASNIYCSSLSNTDVFTLFSIFAILYTWTLRNSLSTS